MAVSKSINSIINNNNRSAMFGMRILLFGEMMPTESCSYRIRFTEAIKMSELGHHVTLVTPHTKRHLFSSGHMVNDNFQVLFSPGWASASFRRGGFSLLDLLYKLWLVLTLDFDILHVTCGHRPAQLIPSLAARVFRRRPTVDEWWEWYGRGGRAETRNGNIEKIIAGYDCFFELRAKDYFSKVIAISSKLKERLKKNCHVQVLHGGVEVDHLKPGDKKEARRQLGLSNELFILGLSSVGRSDHPDLLPLLLSFQKLSEKENKFRIFVTGEENYIREQFLAQPFGSQVIYGGWLDLEKYSLYLRACDVFALPLSNTPRNAGRWPHKIGDFLYFERPIISNRTSDLPELFANGTIGFLCENMPQDYMELIENLMSLSDDELKLACSSSRQMAKELSSDNRVKNILSIYKKLR